MRISKVCLKLYCFYLRVWLVIRIYHLICQLDKEQRKVLTATRDRELQKLNDMWE